MKGPPIRSPGSLLTKVKWLVDAHFNQMLAAAGIDLTPEQWSVLVALHAFPGITQTELANRTFKGKSTAGRILDGLQRRGWVERTGHPADRRANRVHLTSDGQAVVLVAIPVATTLNERILAGLSVPEADVLLDLLERIKDDLARGVG